jgi:UDP-N-acetylmuramoylalanine--D-glutamate ligase
MVLRDYLNGKRIAVIGIGPHGEMVSDIKFLIKSGAIVSIYDLKSEARIKTELVFLRSIGLANYVCSSVPPDDLLDNDLIILSHDYPRESSFLELAKAKNIPIEYPETFFFRHAPPVTLVGVMGMCGKATVLSMLEPILEKACAVYEGQRLYIVDPESDAGIISNLKKIHNGDIVLARITPSMMKELRELRISPHVAVFTTIPGKDAYDDMPYEILNYQTYNNFIIASDEVIDSTRLNKFQAKAKMLRTKTNIIPVEWNMHSSREHDRENASLALQVARLFKVKDEEAKEILEHWKPLKGRLELIKKVRNVEFFNDSASISPCSTICALRCLASDKNAILIFGGIGNSSEYTSLYKILPEYVHTVVLLPGSGTMRERSRIGDVTGLSIISSPSVEESVRIAMENAKKGDRVLFSPGFDAGGFDRSRRERGERFVRAVRAL